jgi:hypothetical protein
MKEFKDSFKNNYYLSKEFIDFCSKVTNIPIKNNTLKNKNIAINNYSKKERKNMQKNNISYMAILEEINKENPSIVEYPIWFKCSYKQAYEKYDRSFRRGLKKVDNYKTKIVKKANNELLEATYKLYKQHMRRLNGPLFSKSFFEEFMKLKNSILFLIYDKDILISYTFCFVNQDNLYPSIGAGHKDYFKKNINYLAYDEYVKYACKNKLNIHFGIGAHNSGYSKFKEKIGTIPFKTERFPDDTKTTKFLMFLMKFKIIGFLARLISKIFPKKIIFEIMPFT